MGRAKAVREGGLCGVRRVGAGRIHALVVNVLGRHVHTATVHRLTKPVSAETAPALPSIDRVTAAAGYSLRTIAGAAGLSHEAIRRYRWRAAP